MYANTGPRAVELDGTVYKLQMMTPEGHSCLVDYIRKTKKPQSSFEKVADQLNAMVKKYPNLFTPDQIARQLEAAQKLDHEERMRERFAAPDLPASAFFDTDVCALYLSLLASPNHPDMTHEKCTEIVNKVGVLLVIGRIGLAFPGNIEKKDLERLAEFLGGEGPKAPTTGTPGSENSVGAPSTTIPSAS